MGFGLLQQIISGFLSSTAWLQFLSFHFINSFITSSLHLFFGRPLAIPLLFPLAFALVVSKICLASLLYSS